MSFPTVRPEDAARLPFHVQERLRKRLAEECEAAAVRHREILAARLLAEIQAAGADPEHLAKARRDEHRLARLPLAS